MAYMGRASTIKADVDRYYHPSYFGDRWVGIRLDLGDIDWCGIADWLAQSGARWPRKSSHI